jgi:excisionase family DNA binding protein
MTNSEKLLSVAEAAERLNVHKLTVIRAIKAGKIPAAKVGRFWRIEPADLEAYIAAGRVTPAPAANKDGGGAETP